MPFNLQKVQPSFAPYDATFNQLGQMSQTQASLGYGLPSTPIMSPFCTPGLNPTSADGAYLQWPSPTMMYAHSYDQFRHAVYQVNHIHCTWFLYLVEFDEWFLYWLQIQWHVCNKSNNLDNVGGVNWQFWLCLKWLLGLTFLL